jgi:hypothetical protein
MNAGIPRNRILSNLFALDKNKIVAVEFIYETYDNVLSDTLIEENDTLNEKLAYVLRKSEVYNPNHPTVKGKVNLKIFLEDHQLDKVRLCIARNEDTGLWFFYIIKETRLGDFYLRWYIDNDLGQLVEQYYLSKIKGTKH